MKLYSVKLVRENSISSNYLTLDPNDNPRSKVRQFWIGVSKERTWFSTKGAAKTAAKMFQKDRALKQNCNYKWTIVSGEPNINKLYSVNLKNIESIGNDGCLTMNPNDYYGTKMYYDFLVGSYNEKTWFSTKEAAKTAAIMQSQDRKVCELEKYKWTIVSKKVK